MIPTGTTYDDLDVDLTEDMEETVIPTKTYKLNTTGKTIKGVVLGRDALEQAILKIIRTDVETFPIYSNNYGVYLDDLIGQDPPYAMAMAKHRIEQAILKDERFEAVVFDNESYTDGKLILDITVKTTGDEETINIEGVTIDV